MKYYVEVEKRATRKLKIILIFKFINKNIVLTFAHSVLLTVAEIIPTNF